MDEIDHAASTPLATGTAAPAPRRGISWVFLGRDGLRAGWSILIFLLLVGAGSWILTHLIPPPKTAPHSAMMPTHTIVGEGLGAAVLLLAAFIMSRIERRPFGAYGLQREGGLVRRFLAGFGWGLVALSVLIGMLIASGTLVYDGVALNAGAALRYGTLWLIAFVAVGVLEEFLFRGYLQFTLARGVAGIVRAVSPQTRQAATIGFWVAAVTFSVALFALAHTSNGGETAIGLVSVSLVGLVFVFSLWRTGSLWWALGFHASWDWAQTYFYGVADSGLPAQGHLLATHPMGNPIVSGGATGPEGSILIVPTLLAVLLVIHLTLPRRGIATTL